MPRLATPLPSPLLDPSPGHQQVLSQPSSHAPPTPSRRPQSNQRLHFVCCRQVSDSACARASKARQRDDWVAMGASRRCQGLYAAAWCGGHHQCQRTLAPIAGSCRVIGWTTRCLSSCPPNRLSSQAAGAARRRGVCAALRSQHQPPPASRFATTRNTLARLLTSLPTICCPPAARAPFQQPSSPPPQQQHQSQCRAPLPASWRTRP